MSNLWMLRVSDNVSRKRKLKQNDDQSEYIFVAFSMWCAVVSAEQLVPTAAESRTRDVPPTHSIMHLSCPSFVVVVVVALCLHAPACLVGTWLSSSTWLITSRDPISSFSPATCRCPVYCPAAAATGEIYPPRSHDIRLFCRRCAFVARLSELFL